VQVVNGITVRPGGASHRAGRAAGRTATTRSGVMFVTGHPQKDGPGVDWARLAESARELRLTLVIYMGISSAARIQAGLLTALPADTRWR
jgi:uroporphyrin-III C-methyltransferase